MRATSLAYLALLALCLTIPTLHGVGAHVLGSGAGDPCLDGERDRVEASATLGCEVCLGSSGSPGRALEGRAHSIAANATRGVTLHSGPIRSSRPAERTAAPPRAPPTR